MTRAAENFGAKPSRLDPEVRLDLPVTWLQDKGLHLHRGECVRVHTCVYDACMWISCVCFGGAATSFRVHDPASNIHTEAARASIRARTGKEEAARAQDGTSLGREEEGTLVICHTRTGLDGEDEHRVTLPTGGDRGAARRGPGVGHGRTLGRGEAPGEGDDVPSSRRAAR